MVMSLKIFLSAGFSGLEKLSCRAVSWIDLNVDLMFFLLLLSPLGMHAFRLLCGLHICRLRTSDVEVVLLLEYLQILYVLDILNLFRTACLCQAVIHG